MHLSLKGFSMDGCYHILPRACGYRTCVTNYRSCVRVVFKLQLGNTCYHLLLLILLFCSIPHASVDTSFECHGKLQSLSVNLCYILYIMLLIQIHVQLPTSHVNLAIFTVVQSKLSVQDHSLKLYFCFSLYSYYRHMLITSLFLFAKVICLTPNFNTVI